MKNSHVHLLKMCLLKDRNTTDCSNNPKTDAHAACLHEDHDDICAYIKKKHASTTLHFLPENTTSNTHKNCSQVPSGINIFHDCHQLFTDDFNSFGSFRFGLLLHVRHKEHLHTAKPSLAVRFTFWA